MTDWVPINGYEQDVDLNDKPRKLTLDEINTIAEQLPYPPSADKTAAEVTRRCIINWIKDTLKDLSLAPSAIPELTQYIKDYHYKSLIAPGTPVGIAAAEAVGATTTQMTLNTFHTSGSLKSASFGIEAMKDLIFARKNPKNESCTIYFKNKLISYEEVLDSRKYIVSSMVSDFVTDYTIDNPNNLEKFWWHDYYKDILNKEIPKSNKVLRLFLNLAEMYKHKVTAKDIADVLEQMSSKTFQGVIVIYGPITSGIIDIYMHPNVNIESLKKDLKTTKNIDRDLLEVTYLETIVYPELSNIKVKGISGIRSLTPVVTPVWRIVLKEVKDDKNPDQWLLYYNQGVIRTIGIEPVNLINLCKNAGITIVSSENSNFLLVKMPNDRYRTKDNQEIIVQDNKKYLKLDDYILLDNTLYRKSREIRKNNNIDEEKVDENTWLPVQTIEMENQLYTKVKEFIRIGEEYYEDVSKWNVEIRELTPGQYIQEKITIDKQRRNEKIKELAKSGTKNVPRTPLMKSAEFVFAETEGSKLKEVLSLPQIDKTRTTCNNMYSIASTLGIEATRTFIIRALYNTITNTGSYIHPINIMLIAEFITSRGEPYGATYTGVSRQPGGHLSLASLERASKVFTQNALFGRKEDIRNVSAAITVGARMAIGDGMFDLIQEVKGKKYINDDLFTNFEEEKIQVESSINIPEIKEEIEPINVIKEGNFVVQKVKEQPPVSEPVIVPNVVTNGILTLQEVIAPVSEATKELMIKSYQELLHSHHVYDVEEKPKESLPSEVQVTEIKNISFMNLESFMDFMSK